jgi:flagellar basal body-associated protein FliL
VKTSRIIVVVACSIIVCAMFSGLVSALSQEEATATAYWVPQAPLPGNSATATIFFVNNSPDDLTIEHISIHFDWMDEGLFVGATLPDPVTVPVNGSQTMSPLLINIPSNVTMGAHTYYIGIDGVQGASTDFSWDSTQLMITIGAGSSSQGSFDQLNSTVAGKLSTAEKASYRSSQAKSLLQQAKTANTQAQSQAGTQDWALAISSLQTASSLLDQAATAEKNYKPTFWDQYLLIVIVGVVVAAVVAVLLVLFMVRRRRKQPETPPAAPTPPPPAEQPSYDI